MCGVYYQTLYVELADIVMETEKKSSVPYLVVFVLV
jgi:hypothetical protein